MTTDERPLYEGPLRHKPTPALVATYSAGFDHAPTLVQVDVTGDVLSHYWYLVDTTDHRIARDTAIADTLDYHGGDWTIVATVVPA